MTKVATYDYHHSGELFLISTFIEGEVYDLTKWGITHRSQKSDFPKLDQAWSSGIDTPGTKGYLDRLRASFSPTAAVNYVNLTLPRERRLRQDDRTTDRRRPKVIAAEAELFTDLPLDLDKRPKIKGMRPIYRRYDYDELAAKIIKASRIEEVLGR